MTVSIQVAEASDLPAVLALLDRSGLPRDGLAEHLGTTLAARENGAIVGCAAVEVYGSAALLRSVAVEVTRRGEGLGERLTEAALGLARERGVQEVFLLTETAAGFFPRFGFRSIERNAVPAIVQASVEFTSACPASAMVMVRTEGLSRDRVRRPTEELQRPVETRTRVPRSCGFSWGLFKAVGSAPHPPAVSPLHPLDGELLHPLMVSLSNH